MTADNSRRRRGKRPSADRITLARREASDGAAWEIVQPRCARNRRDDIAEVEAMIEAAETEIARDELVWLLSECPDFLEAHVHLGLIALEEGDPKLARGHFGRAYELCLRAIEAAGGPRLLMAGRDVTEAIRSPQVTAHAKFVADSPAVKAELGRRQRQIAAEVGDLVTEGRDQGTAVFPDAAVKIFLIASPAERAARRVADLTDVGEAADLEEVRRAIERRDVEDATRSIGPLKKADDAIEVDTTDLTIEQVVDRLAELVAQKRTGE